jgi:hypothetical protein
MLANGAKAKYPEAFKKASSGAKRTTSATKKKTTSRTGKKASSPKKATSAGTAKRTTKTKKKATVSTAKKKTTSTRKVTAKPAAKRAKTRTKPKTNTRKRTSSAIPERKKVQVREWNLEIKDIKKKLKNANTTTMKINKLAVEEYKKLGLSGTAFDQRYENTKIKVRLYRRFLAAEKRKVRSIVTKTGSKSQLSGKPKKKGFFDRLLNR